MKTKIDALIEQKARRTVDINLEQLTKTLSMYFGDNNKNIIFSKLEIYDTVQGKRFYDKLIEFQKEKTSQEFYQRIETAFYELENFKNMNGNYEKL